MAWAHTPCGLFGSSTTSQGSSASFGPNSTGTGSASGSSAAAAAASCCSASVRPAASVTASAWLAPSHTPHTRPSRSTAAPNGSSVPSSASASVSRGGRPPWSIPNCSSSGAQPARHAARYA